MKIDPDYEQQQDSPRVWRFQLCTDRTYTRTV